MKHLMLCLNFLLITVAVSGCLNESATDDDDSGGNSKKSGKEFPFELPKLVAADELIGQWGDDDNGYVFNDDGTYEEIETSRQGIPTQGEDNRDVVVVSYEGKWSAEDDVLTMYYWEDDAANKVSTTYGIYDGVLFLFDNVLIRTDGSDDSPDGTFGQTIEHEEWIDDEDEYEVEGYSSASTLTLDGDSYEFENGWQDWTLEVEERKVYDEENDTFSGSVRFDGDVVLYTSDEADEEYQLGFIMDNNFIIIAEDGEKWDEWGFRKQE